MARLTSIKSLTFKPKCRWHRVGHNTKFMSGHYGNWELRYHKSIVVSYATDFLYVSCAGWRTKTTAERIRHGLAYFGLTLLTRDLPNVWRVADNKGNAWTMYNGQVYLRRNPKTNDWERDGVNPFFTLNR